MDMMQWALDNIFDWPVNKTQCINIPSDHWHWWQVGMDGFIMLNMETGEIINKQDFMIARGGERLRSCGMSFSEMMQDL